MVLYNDLLILKCGIKNAYIISPWHEDIWTVAGLDFLLYADKKIIIMRALYVLKTSGEVFRALLEGKLYDLCHRISI